MRFARLFLAWLLMAALPMQGFAAASMLCKERAAVQAAQAVMAAADEHAHLHGQGHGPGHSHDHASHIASPGTSHDFVSASSHEHAAGDSGAGHDHHACAFCAASCHLIGILHAPAALPSAAPAPSEPADLVVVIHARSPPQPDKPPRA